MELISRLFYPSSVSLQRHVGVETFRSVQDQRWVDLRLAQPPQTVCTAAAAAGGMGKVGLRVGRARREDQGRSARFEVRSTNEESLANSMP